MFRDSDSWQARKESVLSYAAASTFFLVLCAAWNKALLPGDLSVWDARVYANALAIWRAGGDPYSGQRLPFLYPPVFLYVHRALSVVAPGHFGWTLYLVILVVAVLAIPWILATQYIRSLWLSPSIAMVIFILQPKLFAEIVLLSANVGTLFYVGILAAGSLGIRHNRWFTFYVAVVLAASVKPPFLAPLILPLLAGSRQIWRCGVAILASGAIYLFQFEAAPALYHRFKDAVVLQLVGRHDSGFGIFYRLEMLGARFHFLQGSVPAIGHILLIGALFAAFVLLRHRRHAPQAAALWVPALLVLAVLANPRIQYYDSDIAAIPAVFLFVEYFRTAVPTHRRNLIMAAVIGVYLGIFSRDLFLATYLFLIGSVVLVLLRLFEVSTVSPDSRDAAGNISQPTLL